MKVVLFGATGFSGQAVLQRLLQEKHQVTVLVRSASKLAALSDQIKVVEGNVLDDKTLDTVLANQDAVINCLGIGGKGSGTPNSFISTATGKIVSAMERSGVTRLISMSNVGVGDSAESLPWFFRKFILPYFMQWLQEIMKDKEVMEPIIRKSALDWTIARFPNIVDKKARGTIQTSLSGKGLKLSITNPDAAVFLTSQLVDTTFLRKSPSISN